MKHFLHRLLGFVQETVPEALRRRVRQPYLKYFYYPLFPDKRPPAAVSSYPPFADFKARLYRNLPLDLSGVNCYCKPGLVSVVLPVFNQGQWLPAAMESVLAQEYPEIELIIVDDGSTDETPGILARYEGRRRLKILQQSNQGLPQALNAGFRRAEGEYHTWISADNQMLPDQLSEQVKLLRSRPDVEFVYADEEVMDGSGAAFRNSGWCREFQDPADSAVIHWPRDPGRLSFTPSNYIGACFLYRAWVGKIIGPYSPELGMVEDYDYWMRINALFRIAFIGKDRPLYRYRLHSRSLTARYEQEGVFQKAQALVKLDQRRRGLYLQDAEVRLAGDHPWFEAFERLYRQSAYRVRRSVRAEAASGPNRRKVLSIVPAVSAGTGAGSDACAGAGELEVVLLDRRSTDEEVRRSAGDRRWLLATDRGALERFGRCYADRLLFARNPESAAYPLIALLNSRLEALQESVHQPPRTR